MKISYFFSLLFFANMIQAQQMPSFSNKGSANIVCEGAVGSDDDEIFKKVKKICEAIDIEGQFMVAECGKVDNCQARLNSSGAYIFYNRSYLEKLKGLNFTETKLKSDKAEDWDVLCIISHEIAHHILQHLANYTQITKTMPLADLELQADKFAGQCIFRLGGTLEQAQHVMYDRSVSEEKTLSHPSRKERLEAIAFGYNKAKARSSNVPVVNTEKSESEIISDAITAWSESKYKEAIQVFEKYDDNEKVWGYLGTAYYRGIGVDLDYEKSFTYFLQAAEAGSADAQYNIGNMYYYGTGAPQKFDASLTYFSLAAKQGHAASLFSMGELYFYGKGIPTDFNTALNYYNEAADLNDQNALLTLGKMYADGLGVDTNSSKAFGYYKRLADQNDAIGEYWCGTMYESGRGVEANLQEAIRFYKLAAKQGDILGEQACKRLNVTWK